MAAYVIVEITVTDSQEYEEYKKLSTAALAAFDGKFVVRGGKTETLEGDWKPERIVVLEFPTVEIAKEWWNSDIYSKAKAIRHRTAKSKMIVAEGA
ncbi:MAG: DUF1330 domain-containing protein [Bacteroidia bacterium]